MTKIINLYGEPSAGKSTIAAGLFYEMKRKNYKVELSPEWIKFKVYEKTPYPFKDQVYTFAKQRKQLREIMSVVDWIITDSPLLLSLVYGINESELFKQFVISDYKEYENHDFFIERNHDFQTYGRINDEEESIKIRNQILTVLNAYSNYEIIHSKNAVREIMDNLAL